MATVGGSEVFCGTHFVAARSSPTIPEDREVLGNGFLCLGWPGEDGEEGSKYHSLQIVDQERIGSKLSCQVGAKCERDGFALRV